MHSHFLLVKLDPNSSAEIIHLKRSILDTFRSISPLDTVVQNVVDCQHSVNQ